MAASLRSFSYQAHWNQLPVSFRHDPAYLSELLHVETSSRALRSSSDTRMLENLAIQTQDSWLLHFLLLWTPHLEFTPQDLRHCSIPVVF